MHVGSKIPALSEFLFWLEIYKRIVCMRVGFGSNMGCHDVIIPMYLISIGV